MESDSLLLPFFQSLIAYAELRHQRRLCFERVRTDFPDNALLPRGADASTLCLKSPTGYARQQQELSSLHVHTV